MYKRVLMPLWVAFSFGTMASIAHYVKPSNSVNKGNNNNMTREEENNNKTNEGDNNNMIKEENNNKYKFSTCLNKMYFIR